MNTRLLSLLPLAAALLLTACGDDVYLNQHRFAVSEDGVTVLGSGCSVIGHDASSTGGVLDGNITYHILMTADGAAIYKVYDGVDELYSHRFDRDFLESGDVETFAFTVDEQSYEVRIFGPDCQDPE